MSIRAISVLKDCPICKHKENSGCYDCLGKGFIEDMVSFDELVGEIIEHPYMQIPFDKLVNKIKQEMKD